MYGPGLQTYFIRAVVPNKEVEGPLALLKLMFVEDGIATLVHDEESLQHFWKVVNEIWVLKVGLV